MLVDDKWISNGKFAQQLNDKPVACTASLNYQNYNESLPNVEEYAVHHNLEKIIPQNRPSLRMIPLG